MMSSLAKGLSYGSDNLLAVPPKPLQLQTIAEDKTENTGENVQFFTSNVTFSFTNNDSPINERVASLFGRLRSHDPTFHILPNESSQHLNPITSPSNVPTDSDVFANYFSGMSQNSKTTQFYAIVVSAQRINQLKHTKGTFEYLRKYGIYMKYNQLKSTQVKAIGWIYGKHPEADSRHELKSVLSSMIGGFDEFQFNARDVSLARDSPLRTRGWVLEMDAKEADERIETLMEKCHLNARITLVPFMDPSAWDTNGAAETFFIKQNQMLRNSQIVNVNGLRGLDQFTTDSNGQEITLREAFMKTQNPKKQPVFQSVSQVNSKRVCFLTTKDNYIQAIEVIDDFISAFVPALPTAEDREKFLFDGKAPIRVGKRNIPATISTYTAHLKDFSLELDDESRSSLSTPPYRRARGQLSYLDATKIHAGTSSQPLDLTDSTASETQSLGSSWSEFDTKLQKAMDQLTNTNERIDANQIKIDAQSQASAERMKKLEDSVLKSFESISTLATQQDLLQKSISETNSRLGVLSTLLEDFITKKNDTAPSPTRKNRKTDQPSEPGEEQQMDVDLT
jgi:hypothetical protein